jgi:DNA polymerase-3 subunit delta'
LLQQRDEELDRLLNVITAYCEERFAYVTQLAARFSQNRGSVYGVLELWLDYWRDLMLVKIGCRDIITNVDHLDRLVEMAEGYRLAQIRAFLESIRSAEEQLKQNASPRLVLEVLMLDIPRKEGEKDLVTRLSVKNG